MIGSWIFGTLSCWDKGPKKNVPDSVAWSFYPNRMFLVKSFKRGIEDSNPIGSIEDDHIWQGICPSKVEVLVW